MDEQEEIRRENDEHAGDVYRAELPGRVNILCSKLSGDDARTCAEASTEITRLRTIEAAARALTFGAYPAHGSGFVCIVTGGNIDDLAAALKPTN